MADDASKMDEGNPAAAAAAAVASSKPMVDDSPIMRGDEAAKAADMANYFISYAVRLVWFGCGPCIGSGRGI